MRMKIMVGWAVFLFFISGFICAQQKALFTDTFTGKDGTRPPGWTIVDAPESGFWYLKDGQFTTGNGDDLLNPTGFSYAIVAAPGSDAWKDYTVQANIWITQENGKVLLVARWQDKDNHYEGTLETYQGQRFLTIDKVLKGKRTALARAKHGDSGVNIPKMEGGASSDDAKIMTFAAVGNKLSLSLAGHKYLEVEDASFTSGAAGLGEWYYFCYFDDFIVNPAAVAAAAPTAAPGRPSTGAVAPSVAPAAPVVPETIYRILIGQSLDDAKAKNLQNQLLSWGYFPVEIAPNGANFDVLVGSFYSEDEAKKQKQFLEEEGLNPQSIVTLTGAKATEAKQQSVEAAKTAFRVLADEFPDPASANNMKTTLESDGYTLIEVAAFNGKHRVYIGTFNNRDEAETLAKNIKADGYINAKAIEVASKETAPEYAAIISAISPSEAPKPVIPANIIQSKAWQELSDDQKQEVTNVFMAQTSLQEGNVYANEILELKKKINELTNTQKDIVKSIREQAEEEAKRKLDIADLISKASKARDQGNYTEARKFIAELAVVDPGNARIELMTKSLDNLEKNIKWEGQAELEAENAEKIKRARQTAEQMEKDKNYQGAIAQWNIVHGLARPDSLDGKEAGTAIGRIESAMRQIEETKKKQEKKTQFMIYGLLALFVVILVIIIFFGMKSRKHDKELLRQVQELTLKPLIELQEGKAPAALEDKTAGIPPTAAEMVRPATSKAKPDVFQPEAPHAKPSKKTPAKTVFAPPPPPIIEKPAPAKAEIFPEEEEIPVPEIELPQVEPVATASVASEQPIVLEDIPDISDVIIDTKTIEKEAVLVKTNTEDIEDILSGGLKVDDAAPAFEEKPAIAETIEPVKAFGETTKAPEKEELVFGKIDLDLSSIIAAPETPKEEKASEPKVEAKPEVVETTARVEAPLAEPPKPQAPAPAPTPPPVTAAVTPPPAAEPTPAQIASEDTHSDINLVFQQDFDGEEIGKKPNNWKGDYNYASLVVSNESPAPNSQKCIVFNKEKGAGSAFYSCRFPDTEGVVGVEFDFRCDHKNKYLLGFYVEKDEDYRYSVHTVVQYIDSGKQKTQPSLRVQGKAVNYNWGDWCHMKYIVNLFDGTVDGYVNGELVANGEKLASCPSSLNTISIRDNLATVGKLMIDNIKIYKI
ncbi:MAG TPA: SPOR domain-containing protein [Candidatus Sumerlaeota bacterium]|nr:SPOR domain-containing protein [Candidatus Sumerlaeota bacterium]HON51539.1 SPOR domain-containing protein [Candidatus Sumerlaeota bacterium]HOR65265.1 SPOR domain-containing protein [Candidatus Sumerlaeota bacterium]HPL74701.1 SPOR domain-containing protein [Candidatus Sumerlaeota bacterium]